MLWILCSSVYLTLNRLMYALQSDLPSEYVALLDFHSVIRGISWGAMLAGAIALASTRVRSGPPMLRHPGHWLVFTSAVFHLIVLPIFILFPLMVDFYFTSAFLFVFSSVAFVFLSIAYVVAAHHTFALEWKVVFVAMALVTLMQGLFSLIYAGKPMWVNSATFYIMFGNWTANEWLGSLLLAGGVLVVSLVELEAGQRRDWLHWTGVVAFAATSSLSVLWIIGSFLIR